MPLRKIVVFALYDATNQMVLVERRPADDKRFPNKLMFPCGAMEPQDNNSYHVTLQREMREELGALPISYASLMEYDNLDPPGLPNRMMAFLVWHWSPAALPERVLDSGAELHWLPLDVMRESQQPRIKIVADAVAEWAERIEKVSA